jgi:hypothetical protein
MTDRFTNNYDLQHLAPASLDVEDLLEDPAASHWLMQGKRSELFAPGAHICAANRLAQPTWIRLFGRIIADVCVKFARD